jgi:hypothetical protein
MSDALFETEASLREKFAGELDRLAKEFERDYSYRTALRFAARFIRGEDCPVGQFGGGWSVPVDRSIVIRMVNGTSTLQNERERLREAMASFDERLAWEEAKLDTWTAELARGQRTRGGAQ